MTWLPYEDENGYWFSKPCACREKTIMANKLRFADLPPQYKDVTLDNFDMEVYQNETSKHLIFEACNTIQAYLNSFEELKRSGMGLFIWSREKGTGKTRMVASICNKLLEKYQVKFASSTAILNEIKNTWNKDSQQSESKLLDALCTVDILVIDDFGIEKPAGWINDKYYHIINERYSNNKVTIYTSNESIVTLRYDDRITSRIREKTYEITFPEESVREHIAKQNNADIVKMALN